MKYHFMSGTRPEKVYTSLRSPTHIPKAPLQLTCIISFLKHKNSGTIFILRGSTWKGHKGENRTLHF